MLTLEIWLFFYHYGFNYIIFLKGKRWENIKELGIVQVFCIWHKKRQDSVRYSMWNYFFFSTIQFQKLSVENSYKAFGFTTIWMIFWPICIIIEICMMSHVGKYFLRNSWLVERGKSIVYIHVCANIKKNVCMNVCVASVELLSLSITTNT